MTWLGYKPVLPTGDVVVGEGTVNVVVDIKGEVDVTGIIVTEGIDVAGVVI